MAQSQLRDFDGTALPNQAALHGARLPHQGLAGDQAARLLKGAALAAAERKQAK
ncbi:hypothetical protein [Paenarthrobacter ilicis]|uniref:hypothetical protein n=1 Tax=Paenarthrobacter ilicis TaxID=43665 RepID=UPI00386AA6F5